VDAERVEADLPLAALSLVCNGNDPGVDEAFATLFEATRTVDLEQARKICDMVLDGVPEAVRVRLERAMTVIDSEYRSEFFRSAESQGIAKGIAEAKRADLLAVLAARGLELSETRREQVLACADLDRLDTWFHRALTVATTQDVFAE
jgi:hypothetical protein